MSEHHPRVIAIDLHPGYLSSKLGLERAERISARLVEVQHHHAHVAKCMAENGVKLGQKVLGVALDGLGFGDNGTLWGAEIPAGRLPGLPSVGEPAVGGDAGGRAGRARHHADGVRRQADRRHAGR